MAKRLIQPLDPSHDRKSFECESEFYTKYLRQHARQNDSANMTRTFVHVTDEDPKEIMGFMALSMGSVQYDDVAPSVQGRLPRYPIPVLHLGQLATDKRHRGKKVGDFLIRYASLEAVALAERVGCRGLQLVAETDELMGYYQERQFTAMNEGVNRLMYISIETLRDALKSSTSEGD